MTRARDVLGPAGGRPTAVHRLDPRAKVLGFAAITVAAVSAPPEGWPVWIGCALALAAAAGVARITPGAVWRRARFVLPLVGAAVLVVPVIQPSRAGLALAAAVAAKAAIGVVSAVLLGGTTAFPDVLRALAALRVPRLFVLVAGFMYRYLFVVADEAGRMRNALAARGYRPRHVLAGGAVGRVAGALFLRTHARGERVYLAMLARGYRGALPELVPLSFGRSDAAALGLVTAALAALRVSVEVGL